MIITMILISIGLHIVLWFQVQLSDTNNWHVVICSLESLFNSNIFHKIYVVSSVTIYSIKGRILIQIIISVF